MARSRDEPFGRASSYHQDRRAQATRERAALGVVIDFAFPEMRWSEHLLALGQRQASTSTNRYARNGSLEPLRSGKVSARFPTQVMAPFRTLHLHEGIQIATEDVRDFAVSPAIEDKARRLYTLGSSGQVLFYPAHEIPTSLPTSFALAHAAGLPAPASVTPGVVGYEVGIFAPNPPADSTLARAVEVTFVYTYVNRYGEEGPPSLPSPRYVVDPDDTSIELEYRYPAHPDIIGFRLYASYDGAAYRFATPLGIAQSFAEDVHTARVPYLSNTIAPATPGTAFTATAFFRARPSAVSFPLESQTWDAPPDGLVALIAIDNGMMVAASEHALHFCEPFQPHAWPTDYRWPLRGRLVRLARIDGGFVALTDRGCEFFTGSHPAALTGGARLFPHPLVDPGGVAEVEGGVVYATHEGIAFVSAAGGEIMTDGWIDRREWRERVTIGECRLGIFEGRVAMLTRHPGTSSPIGYLFNLRSGGVSEFETTEGALRLGFWTDPENGDLLSVPSGGAGLEVFGEGSPRGMTWRSGDVVVPRGASFNSILLEADAYPVTVKIIPDEGSEYEFDVASNAPRHMPPTGNARRLTAQVVSDKAVARLAIATDLASL